MSGEQGRARRVVPLPVSSGKGRKGPNYGPRIAALEARMTTVETSIKSVEENTATILDVLTHGKSVVGFVQKHGGRIVAFGVGIAVSGGWVSKEVGQFIGSFFS